MDDGLAEVVADAIANWWKRDDEEQRFPDDEDLDITAAVVPAVRAWLARREVTAAEIEAGRGWIRQRTGTWWEVDAVREFLTVARAVSLAEPASEGDET